MIREKIKLNLCYKCVKSRNIGNEIVPKERLIDTFEFFPF